MIVAGLQKLSLVDFPGRLAAVVFLQGCNFKCGYCQNPGLIRKSDVSGLREQEVMAYLERRKDKIGAVVITGGEPTIQSGLEDFIRRISSEGFDVKLDTNGSNPSALAKLLSSGVLEYVALDIKTSFSKYGLVSPGADPAKKVAESIDLCLNSKIQYEFRTTCVPGIVDRDDLHDIGRAVRGAKKYCLQKFRSGVTYDPAFSEIKPFGRKEAEEFADILSGHVDEVELRGF
jgi:pyruvate formate lyase activating enzyme